MAYGTVNADVIQSSVSGVSLGAGNATSFKNRIINGAMVIDQRNAGASVTPTTSAYTFDRWQAVLSQASKYSVQQNAGSVTPPAGFINYLGVTSLSAYTVGASEVFLIQQKIEGLNSSDLAWGTASAASITLSFWIRSSLTGTFGGSLQNSAQNRSYPFSFTISSANTWEQKTITIAGDTSGTWLTTSGVGIYVIFSLASGSTYSGTAGAWAAADYRSATGATSVVGTNGATWYVTGVQLEVGSSATGFDYRDYGRELIMCQRYYLNYSLTEGTGFLDGSAADYPSLNPMTWPATMRSTPSLSAFTFGAFVYNNGSGVTSFTPVNGALFYYGSNVGGYPTYGMISNNQGASNNAKFGYWNSINFRLSAEL